MRVRELQRARRALTHRSCLWRCTSLTSDTDARTTASRPPCRGRGCDGLAEAAKRPTARQQGARAVAGKASVAPAAPSPSPASARARPRVHRASARAGGPWPGERGRECRSREGDLAGHGHAAVGHGRFRCRLAQEQDGDELREGVRVLAHALMEGRGHGVWSGAELDGRTDERTRCRNGNRTRPWRPTAGLAVHRSPLSSATSRTTATQGCSRYAFALDAKRADLVAQLADVLARLLMEHLGGDDEDGQCHHRERAFRCVRRKPPVPSRRSVLAAGTPRGAPAPMRRQPGYPPSSSAISFATARSSRQRRPRAPGTALSPNSAAQRSDRAQGPTR